MDVRTPYWLSTNDRAALADAINAALAAPGLHPVPACHLHDVAAELRVAAARDHLWPEKADLVRRATGVSADVLPIRMSDDEVAAVLDAGDLAPSVRAALTGGKSN